MLGDLNPFDTVQGGLVSVRIDNYFQLLAASATDAAARKWKLRFYIDDDPSVGWILISRADLSGTTVLRLGRFILHFTIKHEAQLQDFAVLSPAQFLHLRKTLDQNCDRMRLLKPPYTRALPPESTDTKSGH